MREPTADIIDRETGVHELADILENIITEAGDLIEIRSPELAAKARTALRRYADELHAWRNELALDGLSSRGLRHTKTAVLSTSGPNAPKILQYPLVSRLGQ